MATFDNIIFDWDGTLAKTPSALANAYKAVLIKRGLLLSDRHFKMFLMNDWVNGLKRYGVEDAEEVAREVQTIFSKSMEKVKLYDRVEVVLKALKKRNKKLLLLTTTPKDYLKGAGANIINYFDKVLTQEDVGTSKLNLAVFEACLLALNSQKAKTLFVGNTEKDAQVGREFGITTVIFYPKDNELYYDEKAILHARPDYVINSLSELLKIAT